MNKGPLLFGGGSAAEDEEFLPEKLIVFKGMKYFLKWLIMSR